MYPRQPKIPLERFFSGLAEQTFEGRLGVADPPLVEYLASLLARFVRFDTICRFVTWRAGVWTKSPRC